MITPKPTEISLALHARISWATNAASEHELSARAAAVLFQLAYRAGKGGAFPSIARLSQDTRFKSTAINDALNELKRKKLITITSGKAAGASNSYRLLMTSEAGLSITPKPPTPHERQQRKRRSQTDQPNRPTDAEAEAMTRAEALATAEPSNLEAIRAEIMQAGRKPPKSQQEKNQAKRKRKKK